jgi:hypothetical protein
MVGVVQRRLTSLSANRSERLQHSQFAWLIDEAIPLVKIFDWKTRKSEPVTRKATECSRGASRPPVDDGVANEHRLLRSRTELADEVNETRRRGLPWKGSIAADDAWAEILREIEAVKH